MTDITIDRDRILEEAGELAEAVNTLIPEGTQSVVVLVALAAVLGTGLGLIAKRSNEPVAELAAAVLPAIVEDILTAAKKAAGEN